jgi:predicted RNA binding protein YcfA (HicA-like mRNA interferase family)
MEPVPSKRLRRLYRQVADNRKNCSFEDLARLLEAAGFKRRDTKGSHVVFKRGSQVITVPFRRPVKEHYIREALELIGSLPDA